MTVPIANAIAPISASIGRSLAVSGARAPRRNRNAESAAARVNAAVSRAEAQESASASGFDVTDGSAAIGGMHEPAAESTTPSYR